MSPIMEWDELNTIRTVAKELFSRKTTEKERKRFCDYLDYVLDLVYLYGWKDAEDILGIVPLVDSLDDKAVNHVIDGKTFRDRITADSTPDDILRIIDTEAHWDYNTGVFDAAVASGIPGIRKRWNTMLDDRVRDPHAYLEGVVVGLNDEFYTYGGESAMYPGGFGVPELDINCRCYVTLQV